MCTCTEPVRTGIGAVCVEHGCLPITMLNHTQNNVCFLFLSPYARTTRYEDFFSLENHRKRLASLARLLITPFFLRPLCTRSCIRVAGVVMLCLSCEVYPIYSTQQDSKAVVLEPDSSSTFDIVF